ncbi:type VI secretion system Vgr family protein [Burkholderia sp. Ax-1719]|uniref:type VI secretion system Vgr family protein n=1 Tax=Burkholderia sp. Ax-1719 TaxID=2608334 RepID=UPI001422766D|nr:type VI secretion system Vgr family protein [Burkholderia sp. Ax-1719]NIE66430.1 type VI secretion system tip protein VgrG [Burkholderia sp. Ax-1719]
MMHGQWQMLGMRGPALPAHPTIGPGGQHRAGSLLVPRRIVGGEAIGALFEYRVEASMRAVIAPTLFDIDAQSRIDLDAIIGTEIALTIDLERVDARSGSGRLNAESSGAGTRHINGIIAGARSLGAVGDEVVYEFVVRPSFWLATQTTNSRAFSGLIIDILHDVMSPYGQLDWRIQTLPAPQRDYVRQAWETDWQFFMRLCEEWGFVVWFEHDEQTHKLVIADNASAYRKHERAYETLRYHTGRGHIDQEYIETLILSSTVTVGKVTVHDHSYRTPRLSPYATALRETYDQPRNTQNADQEIYARADFAQPGTRRDAPYDESQWRDEARHLARVKLEALQGEGLRAEARGALRGVEAGRTLSVSHYPYEAGNGEYLVIGSDLDIRATSTLSSTTPEYEIKASFIMQPVRVPYRMPQTTPRPVLGEEYAVIVGPENAELFLDEFNRVLVQFDWDRDGKYNGKSCIWVRLATSWQGNGMGTVTHARCGQQVLIGYMHGDPDRPVAMSFVVDENNRPPWKMPANQALTGMVSKSLGYGAQTNHLALDDTHGRMQAQLASDHGSSGLSLGYITRIKANEGRQDARGEGFELRTDGHGAIRAALGMLVTSWGRRGGAGKVKELGETIGQLTAARDVHDGAAQEAQRHGAQEKHGDQSEVTRAMKEANARLRGASGNGAAAFPEFEAPDIALSSAANVHVAAKDCVNVASEGHTAFTAGGHFSIAAGKSLFASVREKIAFYAQKAVTLVTPGPVRIESINSSMAHSSLGDLSLTSTRGIVQIAGRNGVDIACGGTLLRIRPEGITGFTDGNFLVHAASHATDKPQPKPVDYPVTADKPGKLAAHHVLVEDGVGFALPDQPYRLSLDDGQVISGATNHLGELQPVTSNLIAFGTIELRAQCDPDSVIGRTGITVFHDANFPPPIATQPPARTAQIGGRTVRTPETGTTSANHPSEYLSCDPNNFGLRSYRFIANGHEEPVSIYKRDDIEYQVAKSYTDKIKGTLLSLNWERMIEIELDQAFAMIAEAVAGALTTALQYGPFSIPSNVLPKISIATPEDIKYFNLHPRETLAVFSADRWSMMIGQVYLESVLKAARKKIEAEKTNEGGSSRDVLSWAASGLAKTIFHEARHCQQTFWITSLFFSYPQDYAQYHGMEFMFKAVIKPEQLKVASTTPFPSDERVKVGIHRMLIFYYWWRVASLKDTAGWEPLAGDFDRIQQDICTLRGATPEQAAKMAKRETGYYTHYHEEDAFATEYAVDQYWNTPNGAFVLNPGVCTKQYEQQLKQIGVIGNG